MTGWLSVGRILVSGLLALAFTGAGCVNLKAGRKVQEDFARWGYPRWWYRVTGGIEIATAGLITVPAARSAGLGVGALVITAALATVLWRRDFSHLPPLGVFAALLITGALTA